MRLIHIEIENFKGIGTRQSIDLKPITLLFGPNSAGKSTILQALHYLREILERRNTDPDQTIAGGLTDLGGFATFVHNHDQSLPIALKVDILLEDEQGSERLPLNSGASVNQEAFNALQVCYIAGEAAEYGFNPFVKHIGLTVEVHWSDLIQSSYVAMLGIQMNGEALAMLESPPQKGRAQLTGFNFAHPLLQEIIYSDDDFGSYEGEEILSPEEAEELLSDPLSSPLGSEIWELSRELSADSSVPEDHDTDFRIAVKTPLGALPDLDQLLDLDLVEIDSSVGEAGEFKIEQQRRKGLSLLLDEMILGPVRIVRDYLNAMTYIGPLRDIPDRGYQARLSSDESRWAQGLAAWDLLYTDKEEKLLNEVNVWLSGEQKLQTGYSLVKTQIREIPVPSPMSQYFEHGLTEDDIGDVQELYALLNLRTVIALRDVNRGIIVAPCDVGVGISQMIPVVVGCLRDRAGILIIEQPELHIHPAIQVRLGDLFIHTTQSEKDYLNSRKSLLMETHSEHIILRILRRIRETTENELPPEAIGLKPDDLSVIFVDKTEQGVQFRTLRVDEEGEFIDRWPKGFFDERTEELF
ncbi:MAG: DUF3696 domain-containing protein [Gammaproteobacteria bacterium]|nr:DUF3696 domain-containing protein [Gammaproteobacteria bacterium]